MSRSRVEFLAIELTHIASLTSSWNGTMEQDHGSKSGALCYEVCVDCTMVREINIYEKRRTRCSGIAHGDMHDV